MKIPKETIKACIEECLKCIQYCENFEACMVAEKNCEDLAGECVTECIACSTICSKLVKELEDFEKANLENRDMLTFKPYINEIEYACNSCIFVCNTCSIACENSLSECRINCKKCIDMCNACIVTFKKGLQGLS